MGKINFFFHAAAFKVARAFNHYPTKNNLLDWSKNDVYIGNVRTHAKDLKNQPKISVIFLKSFIEGDELIPDFSVVFPKGGLREMGDNQSRVLRPVLIV